MSPPPRHPSHPCGWAAAVIPEPTARRLALAEGGVLVPAALAERLLTAQLEAHGVRDTRDAVITEEEIVTP